jgi:OmpA-OmpF porin, OOP family
MTLRWLLPACAWQAPAVAAQPVTGLYVGAGVGANIAGTPTAAGDITRISTNVGPLGLVALGWGFGNGFRVEIERSDRSNDVGGILTRRQNGLLEPLANVGGSVNAAAVMTNVEYDIPVAGLGLPVQPYVGAGTGYASLGFNGVGGNGYGVFDLPQNNKYIGPDSVSFGTAGAFAYQAIVGASLPLHILPGLEATLEHRFFGTAQAEIPVNRVSTAGDIINGILPSSHTVNGFEAHDSAVLIGVRYTFGAL